MKCNIQKYSNECGKYSIINLLEMYGLYDDVDLEYGLSGTNLTNMEKCLQKYFEEVLVVKLDKDSIYDFKPFILLLEKDNSNHYVVVYKRKHNYMYILDSAANKPYKIHIKKIDKITKYKAILVDKPIHKYEKKEKIKPFFLILLSLLETSSILALSITLGDIIDNEIENGIIYLALELVILSITFFKIKRFLKDFQNIDKNIRNDTLFNIYNLNYDYVNKHPLNEIYYRLFDDYSRKSIKLTSLYLFINDLISIILTLLVLFLYSYNYAILFLIIVIPIILIMNRLSKKICLLLENKRKAELEFYAYYIDSFNNKDDIYANGNKEYENKSYELLKEYQESDYGLEKYNNIKNYLLLVFQSLIISSLIILYFVFLKNTMSIGKLVTLISIISSVLSPLLNILSRITDFSNYKLINERMKELENNKKG